MSASITIPKALLEALEEEAGKKGTTPEALLVEMLIRIIEAKKRPQILIEAARASLEHADKLAKDNKILEAYRRVWTSAFLALRAYAEAKGIEEPKEPRDYWKLVEQVAEDVSGAYEAWYAGLASYIAYKEEINLVGHLEAMRSALLRFIAELEKILVGAR